MSGEAVDDGFDPFDTQPMPSRRPVEPTDFLERLTDAMRSSERALRWLAAEPAGELLDPSA